MRFIDNYMDESLIGLPIEVSPRFSTQILLSKSGDEGVNQNWLTPLRRVVLPQAVTDESIEDALNFWLITGGPARTFPFRDPYDFASVGLAGPNVPPAVTGADQVIAEADGFTSTFQLTKTRTLAGVTLSEPINFPVVDSVIVFMNGVLPADVSGGDGGPYTLTGPTRPGGVITLSPVPMAGIEITWGGYFDRQVRWEADDSFDLMMHSYNADGVGPINLVEVRYCEDS